MMLTVEQFVQLAYAGALLVTSGFSTGMLVQAVLAARERRKHSTATLQERHVFTLDVVQRNDGGLSFLPSGSLSEKQAVQVRLNGTLVAEYDVKEGGAK